MKVLESYSDFVSALENTEWLLVYISTGWCSPCVTFSPVVEKIGEVFSQLLTTVKVDAGVVPEVAGQYELKSVPTLLLLYKGELVEGVTGAQSFTQISNWLTRHLLVV